jgi:hypothetical protein
MAAFRFLLLVLAAPAASAAKLELSATDGNFCDNCQCREGDSVAVCSVDGAEVVVSSVPSTVAHLTVVAARSVLVNKEALSFSGRGNILSVANVKGEVRLAAGSLTVKNQHGRAELNVTFSACGKVSVDEGAVVFGQGSGHVTGQALLVRMDDIGEVRVAGSAFDVLSSLSLANVGRLSLEPAALRPKKLPEVRLDTEGASW